ncbi:hypothetical protein J113_26665 [Mycobacterium tuberculosis CAS/NITR204]|uniref:Uncharacterized protein n=1 Tax=Mycobacterium tuberculosis CAS/NITR204 TaxID=1310114 RepID=R4MC29_MYCTX|nr:hypothetical protein J113_26665 [Mycobacterium tuberculosis CAS/NITR204]
MAERAPRGEVAVMVAVQSALVDRPGMLATARGLSHFGEHCNGWLILALLGHLPRRRREWLARAMRSISPMPSRLINRRACGVSGRIIRPSRSTWTRQVN